MGETNRHTKLALCVLFFVMAGQAYGDMPSWLDNVSILPPNPTSQNVVSITVSGEWGDSCIPNASFAWVSGNNIYFEVLRNYPPGIACLQVVCGWQRTQSVGPLSPGVYTLSVHLNDGMTPGTYITQFTVGPPEHHVPSEYSTIQAAINASSNGDVVIVAPGTYTGDGNRDIDFLGKAITVRSADPNDPNVVASTVIDCQSQGRGFYFHNNEGSNSVLAGIKITGGSAPGDWDGGGGIRCSNSSPTITRCIIIGNAAGGYLALGGGIYVEVNSNPTITYCVIADNMSYYHGGGICVTSWSGFSEATISNCIITGNYTIEGESGGGGISCGGARISVNQCTIVGNTTVYGGGISFDSPSPGIVISNTILWGNNASYMGPQIAAIAYSPIELTFSYCDIQGGQAACGFDEVFSEFTLNWGPGNIDADPCFADTYIADYHLQSQAGRWNPNTKNWVKDANTSVCIDAGNPGCPLGDEPNDINNVRINMGADGGTAQASKTPAGWRSLADLTNDWQIDLNDVKVFTSYWLMTDNCLPGDINRNQTVDFKDFAVFAEKYDESHLAEPNIIYNISDCIGGLSQIDQMDQTRFTAIVEGRHIHFTDTMVALCCPERLWLEMTVIGNTITVYEHEHESVFCWCICNYPVDANLGPFKNGIYTLNVYEDYGGFIGSTTVTIE
jgi:hypothetical protein